MALGDQFKNLIIQIPFLLHFIIISPAINFELSNGVVMARDF